MNKREIFAIAEELNHLLDKCVGGKKV